MRLASHSSAVQLLELRPGLLCKLRLTVSASLPPNPHARQKPGVVWRTQTRQAVAASSAFALLLRRRAYLAKVFQAIERGSRDIGKVSVHVCPVA